MVKDGHGKAKLKTVEGDPLSVSGEAAPVYQRRKRRRGRVSISNVMQSNGVIDVVTSVLLPS